MTDMTEREMLSAILKNQETMNAKIENMNSQMESMNVKLDDFIAETRNNFNQVNRKNQIS
ncbi:hypothetical protein [Ferviditalea candida]|uniref:Uncharacterized protein n=1 Tax=Ferviditalea candida TaxID=3108399 RepID=A0ABU5ZE92_9BACL|nr:hypothetical protein [Paenibacillaceae bacterium T2]